MLIVKLVMASAIIKNKNNEILLLKRSKKSSYPNFWQLVEGKLNGGEFPESALSREIREEIGISVSDTEFKSVFFNKLKVKGVNYLCFRLVYKVKIMSGVIKMSDEHATFGWYKKTDIVKLQLLPGTKAVLDKLL